MHQSLVSKTIAAIALSSYAALAQPGADSADGWPSHFKEPSSGDLSARSLLERLPFRDENVNYYALFPGVSFQDYRGDNLLHVRGSRHDELSFSFENIDIRSDFSGQSLLNFIPEATGRLTLEASPRSGQGGIAVFNHQFRKITSPFDLVLRAETDRFTGDHKQRFGTFSYGYQNLLLKTEGQILHDRITFLAAAESRRFADHYRKFWPGFEFGGPNAPDDITGLTLLQTAEREQINLRPGNVPQAHGSALIMNGFLRGDFGPLALRLIGLLDRQKEQKNTTPIRHIFNPDRIPEQHRNTTLISLQSRLQLTPAIALKLQFDRMRSDQHTVDPIFGDSFLLYRDSLANTQRGFDWTPPPGIEFDTNITGPGEFQFNWFSFDRPGNLIASYSKRQENYDSASGSIIFKTGDHTIGAGGRFKRGTHRFFSIGSSLSFARALEELKVESDKPAQLDVASALYLRGNGVVRNYGYDLFGRSQDSANAVSDGARRPTQRSIYIEDYFTHQKLEARLGVRFYHFNSDALKFKNPNDPTLDHVPGLNIPPETLQLAEGHSLILPRFDFRYRYNSQWQFMFNHGKYAQLPQLRNIYASRQTRIGSLERLSAGNARASDAHAVTASQVSFGVRYTPSMPLQIEARLFRKSTAGQLQFQQVLNPPAAAVPSYLTLANSGTADSKGFEMTGLYDHGGLSVVLTYSFTAATGRGSYPVSNLTDLLFTDSGQPLPARTTELEYNNRHLGNVLLNYDFDAFPSRWLAGTAASLMFSFKSGHQQGIFDLKPG